MESHAQKSLSIQPAAWSAQVAALLANALQHATIDDLREQVEHGAQVFTVNEGDTMRAAFVLRIDESASGAEGVIPAAAGDGAGVNLTATILPMIETMFQGVEAYRIHTARPGLARQLVKHHGYEIAELVLRKKAQ